MLLTQKSKLNSTFEMFLSKFLFLIKWTSLNEGELNIESKFEIWNYPKNILALVSTFKT